MSQTETFQSSARQWLRYWRNSLADAESGRGALTKKALGQTAPGLDQQSSSDQRARSLRQGVRRDAGRLRRALAARIAEYVVVHELVHLHEPNHSETFWLRLERAMPDYEHRKQWLAEHGMDVEGI